MKLAVSCFLLLLLLGILYAQDVNAVETTQRALTPKNSHAKGGSLKISKAKNNSTQFRKTAEKTKKTKTKGATAGKAAAGLKAEQRQAVRFNDCEIVILQNVASQGKGCSANGVKYVNKGVTGVRKQTLIIGGQNVMVFVKGKITDCKTLTDKTSTVVCKAIPGAGSVSIQGGCGTSGCGGATSVKPTASASSAASANSTAANSSAAASTPSSSAVGSSAASSAAAGSSAASSAAAGSTAASSTAAGSTAASSTAAASTSATSSSAASSTTSGAAGGTLSCSGETTCPPAVSLCYNSLCYTPCPPGTGISIGRRQRRQAPTCKPQGSTNAAGQIVCTSNSQCLLAGGTSQCENGFCVTTPSTGR